MNARKLLLLAVAGLATQGSGQPANGADWIPGSKPKTVINAKKQPAPTIPVVSNVAAGTKRLVSYTSGMFSPKKPVVRKNNGTTGTYTSHPKSQPPSLWQRMFSSEPPPPPKTVDEWMQLKQIHP